MKNKSEKQPTTTTHKPHLRRLVNFFFFCFLLLLLPSVCHWCVCIHVLFQIEDCHRTTHAQAWLVSVLLLFTFFLFSYHFGLFSACTVSFVGRPHVCDCANRAHSGRATSVHVLCAAWPLCFAFAAADHGARWNGTSFLLLIFFFLSFSWLVLFLLLLVLLLYRHFVSASFMTLTFVARVCCCACSVAPLLLLNWWWSVPSR